MAKQSRSKKEYGYDVYYGTDRNAALQPEYTYAPQERKTTSKSLKKRNEEKTQHKIAVRQCFAMAVLIVAVAFMGIVVVSRNAQIYRNNVIIRQLAQQKEDTETQMNSDLKEYSTTGDLNVFFETAENTLNLTQPTAEQIVTVDVTVPQTEEAVQTVPENKFDTVMDWISSFIGRIQNWA